MKNSVVFVTLFFYTCAVITMTHASHYHVNCRCYLTPFQLSSLIGDGRIENIEKTTENQYISEFFDANQYAIPSDLYEKMRYKNETHRRSTYCSSTQYNRCIRILKYRRDNNIKMDTSNRMSIHPNQTSLLIDLVTGKSNGSHIYDYLIGMKHLKNFYSKNFTMCDGNTDDLGFLMASLCTLRTYTDNTFYKKFVKEYHNDISLWVNSTKSNVLVDMSDKLEDLRIKLNITGLNRTEVEHVHHIRRRRRYDTESTRHRHRLIDQKKKKRNDGGYDQKNIEHFMDDGRWDYILNNTEYDEIFTKIHNQSRHIDDYVTDKRFKYTIRKLYDIIKDPSFKYERKKQSFLNLINITKHIFGAFNPMRYIHKVKSAASFENVKYIIQKITFDNNFIRNVKKNDYRGTMKRFQRALRMTLDNIVGKRYHNHLINKRTKLDTALVPFIKNRNERVSEFTRQMLLLDFKYSKRHFLSHLYHHRSMPDIINTMRYINLNRVTKEIPQHHKHYHELKHSHKNYTDMPDDVKKKLENIQDSISLLGHDVIDRYQTMNEGNRKMIDDLWESYRNHVVSRTVRNKRRQKSRFFGDQNEYWTGMDDPSPYEVSSLPDLLPFIEFIGSWILRLDNKYNTTGCIPKWPLGPVQNANCFYPIFEVTNFTVGPPGMDLFNPQCDQYANVLVYTRSFILAFTTPIIGPILQEYPGGGLTGPFAPYPLGIFVWNATGGQGINALPPNLIACLYGYQLIMVLDITVLVILLSIFIVIIYVWQRIQEKLYLRPPKRTIRESIGRINNFSAELSNRIQAGAAKGLESFNQLSNQFKSSLVGNNSRDGTKRGPSGTKIKSPLGKGGFKLPKIKTSKIKIPKMPIKFR